MHYFVGIRNETKEKKRKRNRLEKKILFRLIKMIRVA